MTQTTSTTVNSSFDDLSNLGEMRVWSVLITIFGDVVAPHGGVVSARTLQAILERLSIKPEAMRVALHRLVKDGWIERQKSGRQSYYSLTSSGTQEFLTATRRIYAKAPELTGPWRLVVLPALPEALRAQQDSDLLGADFVKLNATTFLGYAGSKTAPSEGLVIQGDLRQIPNWVRQACGPDPLPDEYACLESALIRAKNVPLTDPVDATALRVLVVHQWRRILLRHADLPIELMPVGWRGEFCRNLVLELHARLCALANPWLKTEIGSQTTTPQ